MQVSGFHGARGVVADARLGREFAQRQTTALAGYRQMPADASGAILHGERRGFVQLKWTRHSETNNLVYQNGFRMLFHRYEVKHAGRQ